MNESISDGPADERPNSQEEVEQSETDQPASDPDEQDEATLPADQQSTEVVGLADAQRKAIDAADDLLEHDFEGVIKIEATDNDGWRAVVEVLERSAVPDTQDILGRYEITMDATGAINEYGLLERYRRGELKEEL